MQRLDGSSKLDLHDAKRPIEIEPTVSPLHKKCGCHVDVYIRTSASIEAHDLLVRDVY
ncbi:uncharacterized protein METZ01_LOCUS225545 [marine metagenome]|uniref:Uncharacterized protein n=1 Tax=marine metagenome TaxID=408172 RepID=A0A382GES3_9ZZZZ